MALVWQRLSASLCLSNISRRVICEPRALDLIAADAEQLCFTDASSDKTDNDEAGE